MFSMTACVHNSGGQYISKEIPEASCLDDWEAAWDFATVGFVMSGTVDRGVADAYKAFFKKMANNYPDAWWLAYQADWQLRHEWANEEKRRQKAFHEDNPALSRYDPLRPWNAVLKAAVRGVESMAYWEENFKERARKFERDRSGAGNQWVNRQALNFVPGFEGQSLGAQAALPPPPQPLPGQGKRALKRAAAVARGGGPQHRQPPPVRPRTEEAVRPTWADTKRQDGRYLYDYGGVELCYSWNRTQDGCGESCTANPKRAHGCEWCRGQHRAIRCPKHPGWSPEPKGKGKGKGGK